MVKNCTSEDDLIRLCRECLAPLNKRFTLPYILEAKSSWSKIHQEHTVYFAKHKYIPICYDVESNTFRAVVPRPGRPRTQNPCIERVTVRLRPDQIAKLDDYCQTNNIDDYSKAIRNIIDLL
ncbi:MAG: hypothetical protein K0S75_360 [Clostridia bacterium]|nr:hypothetical protein [Clostridia bacterium]